MTDNLNSTFQDYHLEQNNDKLKPFLAELKAYFQQQRTFFTFPIDIHGTEFQLAVWNELR